MKRLLDLINETKEHRIYTTKIEGTLGRLAEVLPETAYNEIMEVFAEIKTQLDEINTTPYNRSTYLQIDGKIAMTGFSLSHLSNLVETYKIDYPEYADLFTNAAKAINEIYEY